MPHRTRRGPAAPTPEQVRPYTHPTAESVMRPDVGAQAEFRRKRPPREYRYDSSLAPALQWDGDNAAREEGEALIRDILEARTLEEAQEGARRLAAMSRPFLDWAGKAERHAFDVPTLPLFVHERLSTRAILESVRRHRSNTQLDAFQLFGDPRHDFADQLRAYEHREDWVNRMILGDSLVVMNSLLEYEGLGGQVQMIYIDPPYGVKFGSNFQPFVRKRDVKHNDDADMTREPEMVQAYRDTWELGLHSYLTYLRDRLRVARELLTPSGSVFVQISEENLHHVRELLDEVFGPENFISIVSFAKTSGSTGDFIPRTNDFLVFYARSRDLLKYHPLFTGKDAASELGGPYSWIELPDGTRRRLTAAERAGDQPLPRGRVFRFDNLQSQSLGRTKGEGAASWFPVELDGRSYRPSQRSRWKTNEEGMEHLKRARRLVATKGGLYYVRYVDDFTVSALSNAWPDTVIAGFSSEKAYVVETSTKVIQRCLLMTTDPGDLVLDPTCGSGTTAYVAEQWGRRWITIDTSRVPLALARQRLLTATYPWYELKADDRGPAGGFVYKRKQNSKGEEVGGIVPHVTLKSIANNEPPAEEVLVDRPEVVRNVTRVAGPFCVEATIPTPVDLEGDGVDDGAASPESYAAYLERMLEVLRRAPVLRADGNRTITLRNVRRPARAMTINAEAMVEEKTVAIVFGPEHGAVSDRLVVEGAREAYMSGYTHLYVIGFGIQPSARTLINDGWGNVPITYLQATMDLQMGDLLKNTRASQIFSVCGMPDVVVRQGGPDGATGAARWEVELVGLDLFDPVDMETEHRAGSDVPCWMLDTDYDGLCFRATQVFFPRTGAWDNLKRALRGEYDASVWEHLAGTVSAPFAAPEEGGAPRREFRVAVKVIDERGNELLVVKEVGRVAHA